MDLDLLKTLYLINRGSHTEAPMINFILQYCRFNKQVLIEMDNEKNLFITKNINNSTYMPCIIAHMDTVFYFDFPRKLIQNGNFISAINAKTKKSCGLTADDSNGIYCALRLLNVLPAIKICFTTQEEVGGIGALKATENVEFFKNVNFLLQADRKGHSDIIIHTNGEKIASEAFITDISPIIKKYDYTFERGIFTDVGEIACEIGISGINISCGYYNEHTEKEICNIQELHKCLNLMKKIITTIRNKKPYKVEFPSFNYQKEFFHKYNFLDSIPYNDKDPYYELFPCDTCKDMDCMHCTKTF